MKLSVFQIDAFTEKIFGGNSACVVPLEEEWLPDDILLKIAKENGVAETAFFVAQAGKFHLRWFTPEIEMDLCGHATLATAHALKTILNYPGDKILFTTLSGELVVTINDKIYTLDFPSRKPLPAELPAIIADSLSLKPKEVLKSRDFVLVYDTESEIRNIEINGQIFNRINLDPGGVIITAQGDHCDFVSRYFTPQASILEDPVTGSAHCSLVPFWSERLGKRDMRAIQLSERVGEIFCKDLGDRVLLSGTARTYSVGTLWTE